MKLRPFHTTRASYLRTLAPAGPDTVRCDLAILEFDDHGVLWDQARLDEVVAFLEDALAETPGGLLVLPFVHGWKNDADPARGNLAEFMPHLEEVARAQHALGDGGAGRVLGVYLGWPGRSTDLPVLKELTFWGRRLAAERIASQGMREALMRIMIATRASARSKCVVTGHSMGGLVVGRALAPVFETIVVSRDAGGAPLPADLVLLANPALDALASWQFIDYLKRSDAQLELRTPDGTRRPAPGPFIVSITSEADAATGSAYPFGRRISSLFLRFRKDSVAGRPSQRHLLTHTEGHVDYLVSHRAWVEDGEIRLEEIPDRFNTTPFWIVRVSPEICADHGDLSNPRFGELVARISEMNQAYDVGVQTWLAGH